MDKILTLTARQWDSRMKTLATLRLKKFRKALTFSSMEQKYFREAILEIQLEEDGSLVVIDSKKYLSIRSFLLKYSDDDICEDKRNLP